MFFAAAWYNLDFFHKIDYLSSICLLEIECANSNGKRQNTVLSLSISSMKCDCNINVLTGSDNRMEKMAYTFCNSFTLNGSADDERYGTCAMENSKCNSLFNVYRPKLNKKYQPNDEFFFINILGKMDFDLMRAYAFVLFF